MRVFPIASIRRKATATFGLALFLLGSNYCLVGALMPANGGRMACMSGAAFAADMPRAAAEVPVSHCSRHAATKQDGQKAPPSTVMPCCIALTPVVATQVPEIAPAADFAQSLVGVDVPCVPPVETRGHLLRAPPRVASISFLPGAPRSPRAPPLA